MSVKRFFGQATLFEFEAIVFCFFSFLDKKLNFNQNLPQFPYFVETFFAYRIRKNYRAKFFLALFF
jgi:hypothetical protein